MTKNVRLVDKNTCRKPLLTEDCQTLSRGLEVMDAILAGPKEGLRVVALCRQTGLERATVYRLLSALQAARYVSVVSRFHYAPGERWNTLVPSSKQREDLARIASQGM